MEVDQRKGGPQKRRKKGSIFLGKKKIDSRVENLKIDNDGELQKWLSTYKIKLKKKTKKSNQIGFVCSICCQFMGQV